METAMRRSAQDLILASLMLGGAYPTPNAVREVSDEYQYDAEILAEYELIKQKKSRLSRNKREIIESKALRILNRKPKPEDKIRPETSDGRF
jgi:hypothetical protein